MNGEDLLRAMEHIDEEYIQEAEESPRRRGWVFTAAGLAACFCLVMLFSLMSGALSHDANLSIAQDTQHSMEQESSNSEIITNADKDYHYGLTGAQSTALQEVPSVVVRVERWTGAGFEATVEQLVDTDVFSPGQSLTVILSQDLLETFVSDFTHRHFGSEAPGDIKAELDAMVLHVMFDDMEGDIIFAQQLWPVEDAP